ncbi:MAG: alpha-hydroxy acid oxidase [Hyphomicrobium sp.]
MTEHRRAPDAIPPDAVNLADYEGLAAERLDPNAWAYVAGGAGDENTIRWNREALTRLQLNPRIMRGRPGGNTRVEILGHTYAHPILVAPVAYQRLAHPDGESATAAAAAAQDAGFVLSMLASQTLESVSETAGPRRWLQLYMLAQRDDTLDLVRRAEAAGYEALVLTVDAPVSGVRDRERRSSFALPAGITAVNLAGYAPACPPDTYTSLIFDHFVSLAPNWSDIEWLAGQTRLPLILKGVLHPDDAELAIVHGAAGIIVSNHGGRTLDTVPATIDVLPAVADRVAGRIPVLMDGGIRRGTDVFKAIASGATAILVGRPIVYGLAVAGPFGVAHILKLLRDELEIAMALAGCSTLADIGPTHLIRP